MTEIHLIGYNIFGIGGTSQSNINLLHEWKEDALSLNYYNAVAFSRTTVNNFKQNHPELSNVNFYSFSELYKRSRDKDYQAIFIITRETFFPLAELLRRTYPRAIIVGEIHTWLANIDDDISEFLPYFTRIRVSTVSVRDAFIKKFHFSRVFVQRVSTLHLEKLQPLQGQVSQNFEILARFDEHQKNISYALKLWDYLIHIRKENFKLYLNGSGPADTLYHTLINDYRLNDFVFINQKSPSTTIALSTSRYESFGYSLAEPLMQNRLLVTTPGLDKVIYENFGDLEQIFWLTGSVAHDTEQLIAAAKTLPDLNKWQNNRQKLLGNRETFIGHYREELSQPVQFSRTLTHSLSPLQKERLLSLLVSEKESNIFLTFRNIYMLLRDKPVIGKVVIQPRIRQFGMQLADFLSKAVLHEKLHAHWYFFESFHGSNFSGDPKYLALAIKALDSEARIFVSSVNSLVDVEIYNHGFEPLRFGSAKYLEIFSGCKSVIVNGNTLDKVEKVHNQIIIQTWHGLPLKKMVNDLEDPHQRKVESRNFAPRMKEWDFLISSSSYQTKVLTSAFHLQENPHLKILNLGAPRNNYLIQHKNDESERRRIYEYMFNRPYNPNTKFILFCPTWRKSNRKSVSDIDFEALMTHLPANYRLIVKLHPLETGLRKYYTHLHPSIHCFFNESVDIQELYILCDLLISDYSSAMFDFAHLGRKIICLQEDINDYARKIGFYFDAADYGLLGRHYTTEQLAQEILSPECTIKFDKICKELLTNDNLQSTEKILRSLK